MKYKIEMFYTVDEDTTFRYDENCKKFIAYVSNGIIVNVPAPDLGLVKAEIESVLVAYSTYTGTASILSQSFTARVSELLGVNTLANPVIANTINVDDMLMVYQGPLQDMK